MSHNEINPELKSAIEKAEKELSCKANILSFDKSRDIICIQPMRHISGPSRDMVENFLAKLNKNLTFLNLDKKYRARILSENGAYRIEIAKQ